MKVVIACLVHQLKSYSVNFYFIGRFIIRLFTLTGTSKLLRSVPWWKAGVIKKTLKKTLDIKNVPKWHYDLQQSCQKSFMLLPRRHFQKISSHVLGNLKSLSFLCSE